MIKTINSNILNVTTGIVGQQVNCQRVMGAGLARQIRAKYPMVYHNYMGTRMTLGECQLTQVDTNLYIANLFGQDTYGRTGTHTVYKSLELALTKMFYRAKQWDLECHLPYNLGCGLAGGDWSIVSRMIDMLARTIDVSVTIHRL